MSDRPDLDTLLETQEFFGLPSPTLVEKDWHVVRALAAIHDITVDGLRLAFGGGTALARAYGLLERMSEDIDLRILGDKADNRGSLKRLRSEVNRRLEAAGFEVEGRYDVKRKERYVRYDLPYAPIASGEGVLRPEIKIELAAFPLHRAPEPKAVISFIAEAEKRAPEAAAVLCVPLVETAADKFVALTRRAGEALSLDMALDPTLVRHLYDLLQMDGRYDADDAAAIAIETMKADAVTRADRYPAYQAEPLAETLRIVALLGSDPRFAEGYARLMDDLVYGDKPPFGGALAAVQAFGDRVRAL